MVIPWLAEATAFCLIIHTMSTTHLCFMINNQLVIIVSSFLSEQWTSLIKLNVSVTYSFLFQYKTCDLFSAAGCRSLKDQSPSLNSICKDINPDLQLVSLFAENFVPVNCRSGLEGVWQFAYQNRFRFTGECNHPGNVIQSCQTPGSQFLITNQKFTISYRKCDGMSESLDGSKLLYFFEISGNRPSYTNTTPFSFSCWV